MSIGGFILLRFSISGRAVCPRALCSLRLLAAGLVWLAVGFAPVYAESLRVTVLLSDEGSISQEFSQALRAKLQTPSFSLRINRAGETLAESDLYLAVGIEAAAVLAARDVPTLNLFVPKAAYEKMLRESAQRNSPRSAIYLEQPLERQVALLRAILPDARNVGVLYSSLPPELPSLRRLLADNNIRLHDRAVGQTTMLSDALEKVLAESEVLFVLPDAEIYNSSTIRNILLAAYHTRTPLLGTSQAYVKAGGLCAVFSTPEQIATQTVAMISRFAESRRLSPAQYPSGFEILVNTQVVRSLDLRIKDAARLRDEIGRIP